MATSSEQDIKTFRNPSSYWEHQGSFSVELKPGVDKSIAPSDAIIRGDTIFVEHGRIHQTMGGIQLYSREKPFFWGYAHMKAIRDGGGKLLWVNWDQQE